MTCYGGNSRRKMMRSLRVRNKLVTLASLLLIGAILLASTAGPTGSVVAKGRSSATVTLKIMHWTSWMVDTNPAWRALVQGFEAQHPGVTISSNFVAFPQYLPTLT